MKGKKKKVEIPLDKFGSASLELTDDLYVEAKAKLEAGEKIDLVPLLRQVADATKMETVKQGLEAYIAQVRK